MSEFVIKDSGERAQFASGMVRDTATDKTDFELPLNGPMFDRWAAHLTKGAVKYPDVEPGVPNWTLASGREELMRFRKSAMRHFRQWLRGDTDEDHAAAVFFNINGYEYVKARMDVQLPSQPKPTVITKEQIWVPTDEPPRRAYAWEHGCVSFASRPHSWSCERQAGHTGDHMAWSNYEAGKLYEGGQWK